ncbi:MAG: glycosyltransferase [Ignavibacteriae bacterium]|nr:MAG: glycosyltransferase [Ignavibacteriota bacterium]RPI69866.1 MAG: glycosyltransferase [Ignavibacteriota bacterium]
MSLHGRRIVAIIPALNEEASIGKVIADLPPIVDAVIVGNNGSTDATADVARQAGAIVVDEPERGYGAACLRALEKAQTLSPDVILFIDGDHSDDPREASLVLEPVCSGAFDLCIGSRVLGEREPGSLTPQQIFGNWLSTRLIALFWTTSFSDLGPFRAITWEALQRMQMQDRNYGWTVEMQIKAAQLMMRCTEVPVSYRRRIGISKVSGTVKGSVMAGVIILSTIFRSVARGK